VPPGASKLIISGNDKTCCLNVTVSRHDGH